MSTVGFNTDTAIYKRTTKARANRIKVKYKVIGNFFKNSR